MANRILNLSLPFVYDQSKRYTNDIELAARRPTTRSNDVNDSMPSPQSSGTAPPTVEPIDIATLIRTREGIHPACTITKPA
jgi:hypothetical protein